jgi:uncharacterized membrane protein YfcA
MAITFLMHVPEHYVVYLIVSFFSGIACGAIGVGGVFLVPTLIIIGIHARVAIVAVVASFFPVTLVYTIFAIRDNRIHIGSYKILVIGLAIGAFSGAILLHVISIIAITIIVSIVAFSSGGKTLYKLIPILLRPSSSSSNIYSANDDNYAVASIDNIVIDNIKNNDDGKDNNDHASIDNNIVIDNVVKKIPIDKKNDNYLPYSFDENKYDRVKLFFSGCIGGFISVLTGTGGAFALLPCFLILYENIPAKDAVTIAIAAGIIIAFTSTLVNALNPDSIVDLGIALTTALSFGLGMPIGTYISHKVPTDALKLIIAILLVILGVYTVINMLF